MPEFERNFPKVSHTISDATYKIVVIGDTGVGKSSLLCRFEDDSFMANHIATIGVDFKVRSLRVDDKVYKLQLWDTAGQERFRTITSSYYRNADGIILVYAMNDARSFENVCHWMNEIKRYSRKESCCTLLVANKSDLHTQSQVDPLQAEQMAAELSVPLVQTSAKDAVGVEHAFLKMVETVAASKRTKVTPKTNAQVYDKERTTDLTQGRFISSAQWLMSSCSIM